MTDNTPLQPPQPEISQEQAVQDSTSTNQAPQYSQGAQGVPAQKPSPQLTPPPQNYVPPQYHTPHSDSMPYGSYSPPQPSAPNGAPEQQTYQNYYPAPPPGYHQKSRIAAGMLALLYGLFGVHNFYLEHRSKAVIQLICATLGGLITCGVLTVAIWIWAFVEGILIFIGNDKYIYDGNNVVLRD